MKARYPGICAATGRRFAAGDAIEKGPHGWQIAGAKLADRTIHPGEVRLAEGEGYGGEPYREGAIFEHKGQWLVVRVAWSEYFREDGLSFGVGDDSGHIYCAICRPATPEEYMPIREKELAAAEYRLRGVVLNEQRERLFKPENGVYEAGDYQLIGEWVAIGKGFNIYGGGEEICICADGIWYCKNNGMDGDNWSYNNVRTGGAGAIGHRFAATPERLAWIAEYKKFIAEAS